MNKKTRAWLIAFSGTFLTAAVYGTIVNCFSILIIPVCSAKGFTRGGFSLAITLLYFTYTLSSSSSGAIYQKHDLKKLMVASSVLLPLLYLALSCVSSLWSFYLLFMAIGLCLPFIAFPAFSVLIHDWFDEKEGTAVGIAFMGSGIGGMILNVVVASWIENYGFSHALRLMALLMAVCAIPVSLLVIKPCHENYRVSRSVEVKGKRSSFILPGTGKLMLMAVLIGFGITLLSQSMPPHLEDLGYSPMYAARMNSLFMGFLCVAKLLMGMMFDRFGLMKTMVGSLLIGVVGALSYYFAAFQSLHVPMVIGAGVAVSLGSVAYPILARHMCSEEVYATASGNAMAFNMLGSAVAPFFLNLLYDAVGSYRPGYLISVVFLLLSLALLPRERKRA